MEAIANILSGMGDSNPRRREPSLSPMLSQVSNGRKTQNGTRMKIQMSQRNKTEALSLVSSKAMTVVKLFSEHK
jgi:hypothetical protein